MRFVLLLALVSIGFAAEPAKLSPASAEERAALNAAEVRKLNLEISFQQSQIQMLQQQISAMGAVFKAQGDVDQKLEDIRKAHGAGPGCAPKDDGAWKCPEPNPPPAKK